MGGAARRQSTRQRSPPIMPNQHDTFGACGIDQRRHIVHKMRQSVVCDLRGPGGAPVSALIDRPDAIAQSCQHRYLVPPGDGRAPESRAGRAPTCLRCPPPAPRSAARWPQRTWSAYPALSNVRANLIAGSNGVSLRAAASPSSHAKGNRAGSATELMCRGHERIVKGVGEMFRSGAYPLTHESLLP